MDIIDTWENLKFNPPSCMNCIYWDTDEFKPECDGCFPDGQYIDGNEDLKAWVRNRKVK